MKAEELATQLRIGNLIKTDDGIICSIECIESKQFTEWNSGNDYSITAKEIGTKDNYLNCINDSWKPIHLSEEVLLKCGFEKCEKHENFYQIILNDWTKIYVAFHEKQYAVELSVSKHSFCPKVKHLHQLQNIYYALTGEELEVSI